MPANDPSDFSANREGTEYPVVYLTGAPAAGKSTLARNLAQRVSSLKLFIYSEELRKFLARKSGSILSEEDIRAKSAAVVTAEDVRQLDNELIEITAAQRKVGPVLIDSHPVTKESYGFRVTSFDEGTLRRLAPTSIICLYTDPETTVARIAADPMGRPQVTLWQAQMHTTLQTSLAAQYGVLVGSPAYMVDSAVSPEELVEIVLAKSRLQSRLSR